MSEEVTIRELEEAVVEGVIARLKIDQANQYLRDKAVNLLKAGAKEHVIASIWQNMSDDQALHFQNYVGQSAVIEPELSSNEVLMKFAELYPDLRIKVSGDLGQYFDNFVSTFNQA